MKRIVLVLFGFVILFLVVMLVFSTSNKVDKIVLTVNRFEHDLFSVNPQNIIEKLNRRSCLIEDVVVEKKERGKGIGKLLIEHLINFSKSKSCDKIILNSKESNIPFYNKLGFVQNEIQMVIRN